MQSENYCIKCGGTGKSRNEGPCEKGETRDIQF